MINKKNFQDFLDIEVDLHVNISSIKLTVNEVSKLKKGSIIDFGIPAGSLAQVLINDKIIGKAEIMVFEKYLAIRLNEISDSNNCISEGKI